MWLCMHPLFATPQLTTAFVFDSVGAMSFVRVPPSARRVAGVVLATLAAITYQVVPKRAALPSDAAQAKGGDLTTGTSGDAIASGFGCAEVDRGSVSGVDRDPARPHV